MQVSPICLGTGEVGSSLDRKSSFALLDAMVEQGGNFIDTAHNYGDWVPDLERSAAEKMIGAWLSERKNRNTIVLATKGAHPLLDGRDMPRMTRKDICADLDDSLRFLRTGTIDLYYLHRDDPHTPVEEVIEVLNDQVKVGKIRYFAASNWKTERIAAAQKYAQTHGLQGFSADQCFWNAAVRGVYAFNNPEIGWMNRTRYVYHIQTGMAVIPFQSQAFGLFQLLHEGRLDEMNPGFRGFYKIPDSRTRYERICQIMAETGLTITQVILGYLINQPFVTVPIVGCQSPAQVADSFSAAEARLTLEQIHFIETGDEPYAVT